jgi:hypothetical protein
MVLMYSRTDLKGKSDQEVLALMDDAEVDSDLFKRCVQEIQIRHAERLATCTKSLAWATWGLLGATLLLFLETIWGTLRLGG